MADILTRLLPAVRDVRNPLAVGYSWLAIGWAVVTGRSGERSDVEDLLASMTDDLSDLVVVAATTFAAVLLGSGLVRLMDRVMQLSRTGRGRAWNPLDRPEKFGKTTRSALHGDSSQIAYYPNLRNYVVQHEGSLSGWRVPDQREDILEYELTLFRENLADDADFGAYQAENLLRFSMIPPVAVAAILSAAWAAQPASDRSPVVLVVAFVGLGIILWLDYLRTGSLMLLRWQRLARAYPRWLPKEVQESRERDLNHLAELGAPGPRTSTE